MGSRRRRALSAMMVVVVLFAGCSDNTTTSVKLSAETPDWLAREIRRMVAEDATEAQAPFLEDGVVTAAEREAAYLAYLDCLEQSGHEVLSYQLRPDGDQLHLDHGDLGETESVRMDDKCRSEHYNVVGIVFTNQNRPSAEQEAEWWREAGECMRRLGHDVPDSSNMVDLMAVEPFVAAECYDEAAGLR